MAVGFSNTNKPLNPRGNDASPKGYNRASLFSGKALDFDGVNDYVSTGTQTAFDMKTIAFYFIGVIDSNANGFVMHPNDAQYNKGVMIGHFTATLTDECLSIGDGSNYTTIKETFDDGIHFAVFSWDATNSKYKIFVNGVELTTENNGADSALISGVTSPVFGKRAPLNDFYLDGGLSNIRLFDVALTAAQVADLYNNPEKVVPTGVDNTALKLWLPMQEGAGTTAFNGAPDALGSEEVTNGDFATDSDWSKTGDWEISGGSANSDGTTSISNLSQNITFEVGKTYRYSFTISNRTQGGVRAYIGAATGVLNESNGIVTGSIVYSSGTSFVLQSRNNFIGSVDNVSIKEENNFGTISGATWTHGIGAPVAQTAVISWNKVIDSTYEYLIPQGLTSGRDLLGNLFENVRKQGALNLDGNSWAEVHDNASLDITDAITLEAWVYADEFADMNGAGIIAKWDEFNEQSYLFYTLDYNTYYFFISSTGSNNDNVTFSLDIADENKYNHLVCVYDGSNITMYKNGNVAVTDTTALSSIYVSDKVLEIGRYDLSTTRTIETQIAQPRIYNRALTAAEVLQNYNSGKNTYK